VLAQRMRRLGNRQEEVKLLEAAAADAPPRSVLRRLAREELLPSQAR
jgi:hypothetical protein